MQLEADGAVNETIEDGVGEGGIVQLAMPVGDRQLAGDDHRAPAEAVVEDHEEIASPRRIDRRQSPVVQDEHLDPGEIAVELGDGAPAMGDPQLGEQPRHALVLGLVAFQTGLMGESAGEPTLARAARAGDQDIGAVADPGAIAGGRVVEAVKEFNGANRNERITFRLASGNVGVMAATNEEVEAAQFPILAYVYAAVIVLCLIWFRSVAATVCIIVPLAVVSLLAYALMALLEIGLKVSTLPVVALGVEIGVDYGIYIYGKLRIHLEQGLDFAAAYERTLATTGAGVVLTGLTLAASVATWILAPLKFQADMGTVLTFMFLVNMVGAVVLLPALGAWLVRPGKTATARRCRRGWDR